MHLISVLYHAAVVLCLVGALGSLLVNLSCFGSLQNKPITDCSQPEAPLISVLVPARNEERRIRGCVESLLAQDYANCELLVLDDHSEDATAEILRELGKNDTRLRSWRGEELPAGWVGKCWACHQLAQQARGEYLFFTDADTVHAPQTISAAVAHARETRADLLSAWPRLMTKTWSEKLMIPVIHVMALIFFPIALITFLQKHPRIARAISPRILRGLGGANGQFLFFRASAYAAIGGHAAVRSHLVEDVALGREVAQRMGEGMRLVNCDASRLVECRMYSCFREVWEGFTKNAWPAFENSHVSWWCMGALQFTTFFLPFALVFFAEQRRMALVEIALIYLMRVILTLRMRTSWMGCWLHPCGHALAMAIALNSWRLASRQGVTWKGRVYRTE